MTTAAVLGVVNLRGAGGNLVPPLYLLLSLTGLFGLALLGGLLQSWMPYGQLASTAAALYFASTFLVLLYLLSLTYQGEGALGVLFRAVSATGLVLTGLLLAFLARNRRTVERLL